MKLSIAHPDASLDEWIGFYDYIKNSDQEILNKIEDIYFGYPFHYEYNNEKRMYGNVMKVYASDLQVDYLFKIQNEFNIPISLTFNQMVTPNELLNDHSIQNQFYDLIQKFYDRGLRSCTISATHLLRIGELKKRFPEMSWKNTVNHMVKDSQQVIDYLYLGYDIILIDRSLTRNLPELRRIRKAVDYFNEKNVGLRKPAKISLLVAEACLGGCPFKVEHDNYTGGNYFGDLDHHTCQKWRFFTSMNDNQITIPRFGVDLFLGNKETYEEFSSLVDIFKYSGRLGRMDQAPKDLKMVFGISPLKIPRYQLGTIVGFDFIDLISNNFDDFFRDTKYINFRLPGISFVAINKKYPEVFNDEYYESYFKIVYDHISAEKMMELNNTLKICKNICWSCHKCEETFGIDSIDSALQV